jgi:hypothetical protein
MKSPENPLQSLGALEQKTMDKKITRSLAIGKVRTAQATSERIMATLLINRKQEGQNSGHLWEKLGQVADQNRQLIQEIQALRHALEVHLPLDSITFSPPSIGDEAA